jgi:ion channel-forming bestrophin family protein
MKPYDPHSWTDHLFDIEGSLFKEIIGRVTLCMLWTVVVVMLHELKVVEPPWLEIPETAHSLVGGALALLLVFRTNASYDRFWEGRKLWGGIVNETRNLARQILVFFDGHPYQRRSFILWTIAFPYAAMHRLRGIASLGPIAPELPPSEVEHAIQSGHAPLAVTTKLATLLREAQQQGQLSDIQQMQIDQNLQQLVGYIGACERIHSTPLPYAYAVHLRRALILYCFTLPFALVARFGWDAVLATFLIAFILFGIEEIGVEIEDPFGTDENDLPLQSICEGIEKTLRQSSRLDEV